MLQPFSSDVWVSLIRQGGHWLRFYGHAFGGASVLIAVGWAAVGLGPLRWGALMAPMLALYIVTTCRALGHLAWQLERAINMEQDVNNDDDPSIS